MLPAALLRNRIWLILAIFLLIIEWSLPVVAQALYAETNFLFSLAFAIGWCGLIAGLGLFLYEKAKAHSEVASLAITLSVATLVLLYRAPLNFVQPQFAEEDACIFFVQNREMGWSSILMSYNGYYHTVIRLVAALASLFPTLFAPALYNLSWLAIYSLVATYILFQYPDKKLAPIMVLVTAVISHTCEVFLVLTDAIWLCGLALTVFVLFPIPKLKGWSKCLLAAVLGLFSVSGPFSLILAPFYILRWLINRKGFPLIYILATGLGAALQVTALHSYYAGKPTALPFTWETLVLCLKIVVLRIPWSLAVGYQPVEPYWLIGLVVTMILLAFVVLEIKSDFKRHFFATSCFLVCGTFVAMDLFRIKPLEELIPLVNGDRYFYIPKILFVWALIHLASTARNPLPFYIALFFCSMGSVVEFTGSQIIADNHWPKYAVLIDQGQRVYVPVNPPGWGVVINPHGSVPSSQ